MRCVKCGFENAEGAKICRKCGVLLFLFAEDDKKEEVQEPEELPVVNDRLKLFENAVAKVRSGAMSVNDFADFLEKTAAILSEKEQEIKSIDIPKEAIDDFKEELAVGFAGMDLYNQGIESMFAYVEELDDELLERGLELVRSGNERINEAMRINRENRNKLEEPDENKNLL